MLLRNKIKRIKVMSKNAVLDTVINTKNNDIRKTIKNANLKFRFILFDFTKNSEATKEDNKSGDR